MDDEIISPDSASSNSITIDRMVDGQHSGMRLDQFLSLFCPTFSRTLLSVTIRKGEVLVDGQARKSSYRLKSGEKVQGLVREKEPGLLEPEKIDFPILYEDSWLILLAKPPGLVVHPGSGHPGGTLVNGLLHHFAAIREVGDCARPGIVHRLDKDTSGIMVVAKTEVTHRRLVEIFKARQPQKEYLAILCGRLNPEQGRLAAAIGRHPVHRQKMAVLHNGGGKHAATSWQSLGALGEDLSLARLTIETGRTHQIRVHMASLGFPVAGDEVYGKPMKTTGIPRQMLHSYRLVLPHPHKQEILDFVAPPWPDFYQMVKDHNGLSMLEGL